MIKTEIAQKADFSAIRYAQCWEDADILLEGLAIQPGQRCLSIASAGDNALAMLSQEPKQVIAVDLNPAQLACLELRVAAYRTLHHQELLELVGSRPSNRRLDLYRRCRHLLCAPVRSFWDQQTNAIRKGIGCAGKFERFLMTFRRWILPLAHQRLDVSQLLSAKGKDERRHFYDKRWNTRRWQALFRLFFSRTMIGRFGRDPHFFDYVENSVADHLLSRVRHALVELEPSQNPYLHWILTGRHLEVLPYALRPENFAAIRDNLDRLEWHQESLEAYLATNSSVRFDRFNLSDVFEYQSVENYHRLLDQLINASAPGARLAYWNMLVPRSRPDRMAHQLQPLSNLAERLYAQDKAFFYRTFVLEEVVA